MDEEGGTLGHSTAGSPRARLMVNPPSPKPCGDPDEISYKALCMTSLKILFQTQSCRKTKPGIGYFILLTLNFDLRESAKSPWGSR